MLLLRRPRRRRTGRAQVRKSVRGDALASTDELERAGCRQVNTHVGLVATELGVLLVACAAG